MRTTLALDDDLLAEAERLTGTSEKSALVRMALRALIEKERRAPGPPRCERARPDGCPSPPVQAAVILVDTSVWVDHLRRGDSVLAGLLERGMVLGDPWVAGEVALAQLHHRADVLGLLRRLPRPQVASDQELALLIEDHELFGRGLGYVDAQLLAAARLTPPARLWTRDTRLDAAAARLGLRARPDG